MAFPPRNVIFFVDPALREREQMISSDLSFSPQIYRTQLLVGTLEPS